MSLEPQKVSCQTCQNRIGQSKTSFPILHDQANTALRHPPCSCTAATQAPFEIVNCHTSGVGKTHFLLEKTRFDWLILRGISRVVVQGLPHGTNKQLPRAESEFPYGWIQLRIGDGRCNRRWKILLFKRGPADVLAPADSLSIMHQPGKHTTDRHTRPRNRRDGR